jgi:hypothetical protein
MYFVRHGGTIAQGFRGRKRLRAPSTPFFQGALHDPSGTEISGHAAPYWDEQEDEQGHPDRRPVRGARGALGAAAIVTASTTGVIASVIVIDWGDVGSWAIPLAVREGDAAHVCLPHLISGALALGDTHGDASNVRVCAGVVAGEGATARTTLVPCSSAVCAEELYRRGFVYGTRMTSLVSVPTVGV